MKSKLFVWNIIDNEYCFEFIKIKLLPTLKQNVKIFTFAIIKNFTLKL